MSNTTCITHVFFKSDESRSKFVRNFPRYPGFQGFHDDAEEKCQGWGLLGFNAHSQKLKTFVWGPLFERLFRPAQEGGRRPLVLRGPGATVLVVGGGTTSKFEEEEVLPWAPAAVHIFEPVRRYHRELRRRWRGFREVTADFGRGVCMSPGGPPREGRHKGHFAARSLLCLPQN